MNAKEIIVPRHRFTIRHADVEYHVAVFKREDARPAFAEHGPNEAAVARRLTGWEAFYHDRTGRFGDVPSVRGLDRTRVVVCQLRAKDA